MSYFIVLLAVLARFAFPHPPNFSPVYGALLFGGAYLKRRDSIWYPLALLAVSDVVLTTQVYHMRLGWRGELVDLLAFALLALVGGWLRDKISARTVIAAALAGPTAFFLVSNLGVWMGWQMYPATWEGLLACYVAALPFFPNSLVSGLLYSALLFGAYEYFSRKLAVSRLHKSLAQRG